MLFETKISPVLNIYIVKIGNGPIFDRPIVVEELFFVAGQTADVFLIVNRTETGH